MTWKQTPARDVRPGDRIRHQSGTEFTVSRIETGFMGRPGMIAFIEDSSERWFKAPTTEDAVVDVKVEDAR